MRLVDGLNLIGSRPDGWWRDRPAAMRSLVAELEAYAAVTAEELVVVFDGRPLQPPLESAAGVTVVFAPARGPGAADDEIVRWVTELANRPATSGEVTCHVVVTSDHVLADRVRARGGEVESSGAFRRRMAATAEVA